jgi:hypothetical protein
MNGRNCRVLFSTVRKRLHTPCTPVFIGRGVGVTRASIRIVRLLAAMEAVPELRESAYGWLTLTADTMKISRATASRDFALARRIHAHFIRLFGRTLEPRSDQIKWSWDWSHYGFLTRESIRTGIKKPVGHFPFD